MLGQKLPNLFDLNERDTTTAFIDGPALHWAYKAQERENLIDMVRLKTAIEQHSRLQSITYYTMFKPGDEFDPVKPLAKKLSYNGFRVVAKEARHIHTDLGTRVKGSINIDLALDTLRSSMHGVNHVVLVLSDDDFVPLVKAAQEYGCRVSVVSTRKEGIVSDRLLVKADSFIDLADIASELERRPRDR